MRLWKLLAKSDTKTKLAYILLVGGAIGVLCSALLTLDKIQLAANPGSHLSCNINPIVACGTVSLAHQSSVFGFPNPFLGLVGFAVVATIGAGLLAGATFKRWFWLGLQLGALLGIIFITWLQFQSIFVLNTLCPYCMVVWAVTIPIFIYTSLYNFQVGNLHSSKKLKKAIEFCKRHHLDILIAWYLVLIGTIIYHFWYYWQRFLK